MNDAAFFNPLDYVYMSVILISSVSGIFKGFTRVSFSLFAWVISGFLSVRASPRILGIIKEHFYSFHIAQAVSVISAYVVILIALLMLTRKFSKKIKRSALSDMDRAAGGIFGIIRGFALPLGMCLIFTVLHIDHNEFYSIKNSKIFSFMVDMKTELFPNWNYAEYIEKQKNDLKSMVVDVRKKIQDPSLVEEGA